MCLRSQYSESELKAVTPNKTFVAYKFCHNENGVLKSPCYHYLWSVGNHTSDHSTSGEGFYVMLFKPGEFKSNKVRLEVSVNPKDIVKGGPDSHEGFSGTCFVVKKLKVSQKQYDKALGVNVQTIARKAKPIIKKAKKSAVKRQSKAKKLIKKIKKKIKKVIKKK